MSQPQLTTILRHVAKVSKLSQDQVRNAKRTKGEARAAWLALIFVANRAEYNDEQISTFLNAAKSTVSKDFLNATLSYARQHEEPHLSDEMVQRFSSISWNVAKNLKIEL